MTSNGLRAGHFAALVGAIAALASLWRPWYVVRFPQSLRDAVDGQLSSTQNPLGSFVKGVLAAMPDEIKASAWRELAGADVAMAAGALAVIALVLGAAGAFGSAVRVDPTAAGRWIAILAGAGLVLVAEHAIVRPGGAQVRDLVHLASGMWIALAGCGVAAAGGLLASRPDAPAPARAGAATMPALYEAPATPALDTGNSVPPPRRYQ